VVAFTPFRNTAAVDVADVMLPIAPFTETAGSFVNAEGRLQAFHGVVKPLGDARPGWKVLRVLGNLLGLQGFDFETAEDVCTEALGDGSGIAARLGNNGAKLPATVKADAPAIERLSSVGIYHADALVRRSAPLQLTADARQAAFAGVSAALWEALGLESGGAVRVSQGDASAVLPARLETGLAPGVVRLAAGHPATAHLGALFGDIKVEKA
jgi:NADH-quinone oxidoreductase subunit G